MTHKYIGTKEIMAWPQDKVVDVPQADPRYSADSFSKELKQGYAVKYADGYTSWSPKDVFEAAYRVTEGEDQALTFGDALHFLKQGKRVARKCWDGMALEGVNTVLPGGQVVALWLASQSDLLANDWMVLP